MTRRAIPPRGLVGELVACKTSMGYWIVKHAITDAVNGHDFPVVWVRWPDEGDETRHPWPMEDVVLASEHPDALTHDEYRERNRVR